MRKMKFIVVDEGKAVIGFYFDFSKVFETVKMNEDRWPER